MTLIKLKHETIGWKDRDVLVDVELSVEEGERIAILGRSGAGKSTLINYLYRRFIGDGRAVALIPQDHALVLPLSVFHNVYMGQLDKRSTLYNLANLVHPKRREVDAIRPILAQIALEDEMYRAVERLSGGQKQRTAIARALFRGGTVILGDEPVSAIDEKQAAVVLEAIRSRFSTVLLALHDVDLALAYCNRIVGLAGGRIVLDSPSGTVERRTVEALYAD
jgi:phosphonate transport system ATP-binding protein